MGFLEYRYSVRNQSAGDEDQNGNRRTCGATKNIEPQGMEHDQCDGKNHSLGSNVFAERHECHSGKRQGHWDCQDRVFRSADSNLESQDVLRPTTLEVDRMSFSQPTGTGHEQDDPPPVPSRRDGSTSTGFQPLPALTADARSYVLRVAANGTAIDARDRSNVLNRRPLRHRGVRRDAVNMCEGSQSTARRQIYKESAGLPISIAPRLNTCVYIIVVLTSACPSSSCTVAFCEDRRCLIRDHRRRQQPE